jgi:hypothetical protein
LTSCNAKSQFLSKCLSGLSPDALCRSICIFRSN